MVCHASINSIVLKYIINSADSSDYLVIGVVLGLPPIEVRRSSRIAWVANGIGCEITMIVLIVGVQYSTESKISRISFTTYVGDNTK